MITSNQRKQIERMAYDAIKALTGEQLELKMIGYSDIIATQDKMVKSDVTKGIFEFEITNREFMYTFLMNIENSNITTLIRNYE